MLNLNAPGAQTNLDFQSIEEEVKLISEIESAVTEDRIDKTTNQPTIMPPPIDNQPMINPFTTFEADPKQPENATILNEPRSIKSAEQQDLCMESLGNASIEKENEGNLTTAKDPKDQ